MSLRFRNILLLLLTIPAVALADGANPQDTQKLLCDGVVVTAYSNCLRFDEQERQCKTQTLELQDPGTGRHATLAHAGKLIKQPFVHDGRVLDAIATGWTCLKSKSGISYVYVLYTCVESDNSPECASTHKEWEMLYGTNGQNMTPSLPRRGKVRARELTRIYRRLGLESIIEQPFQLQGIKY